MKTCCNDSTLLSDIEDSNGNIIDSNWQKFDLDTYKHKRKCLSEKTGFKWSFYNLLICNNCNIKFLIDKHSSQKTKSENHFCSQKCKSYFHNKDNNILLHKEKYEFYYLLGLIATDGYLRKDRHSIHIKLQELDKHILDNIKSIFKGNINFVKSRGNNQSQLDWSLFSKETYEFLKTIGITTKKSLTLDINKWFQTLTYEQKLCFTLGCLDGDGSISTIQSSTKHRGVLSFGSSSKSFITTLFNFIKNDILYKKYNILAENKIYEKTYKHLFYSFSFQRKNDLKIILNEVYSTVNINSLYLIRKYNNALEILQILQ